MSNSYKEYASKEYVDSKVPSAATSEADGLMSSTDKAKVDGIADGATRVTSPADIGAASTANAETWVFTLADGSTVSKEVILK